MTMSRPGLLAPLLVALLSLTACERKQEQVVATSASASASAPKPAAPVASGLPGAAERVKKVVNPENAPAYAGPTGTVRGVVSASGDQPSATPEHLKQIKGACPEGREAYSHVFREGMMRSLADVLVAVTGYEGYVPEREPKQVIAARGCAFSARTVALTFGQALDVVSKDSEAYAPSLLGARTSAQLLALPGGVPSTMYPPRPGHYLLTDDMKLYMMADVFVLKYSTHDVTRVDGKFEIKGIPVGKARLSALLPSTQAVVEKEIVVEAGKTVELALELPFDAKAHAERAAAAKAAAAASASAKPAAPAPPAVP